MGLSLDTIVKYLHDPMKTGVYNHICIVDFSGVSNYLKELMERYKESQAKTAKRGVPRRFLESRLSRFSEELEQLDGEFWGEKDVFKHLSGTFRSFAVVDGFPEEIGKLFYHEREHSLQSGRIVKRKFPRMGSVPNIFDSHIQKEAKDAVSIEKTHISKRKWLFDVVTIKENGLSVFKKCLGCIPPIKEQMEILKERKHFSARYTFRPYPLATELWLEDEASVIVPPDLKSFLKGAIRYVFSSEWRTSIVLSAITVESVLADLYEEKFKKPAPDAPLGDLFRQVREKIDFPPEIVNAIEMANEARIAAVHRSRFPVSDREAINALYGAANFTLWYSS